ncbi:DUF4199 domain-containing protein [Runella slithyformis]|uniref:DUF4199 domain-containing protein n=1 Tax=Runella slithyformis (strain ATCC 29530 / DSM 19594 / LMG 11500 / NCIMB 11436 / LSU 4) TaxID=761193 RepID=A0A7U4E8B9_RUNSL|nr:DUF4199 domain-containing protein [Runella slithyformis]AEI51279.1 hypothetical protein Runsl_4970 [Runella slithyformis DSM 19594]
MQKTIMRFGLLSGAVSSILLILLTSTGRAVGLQTFAEYGAWLGFTSIILSLSLVYFGIRSYRDQHSAGKITFGKAFQIGILVTVISCVCYSITWGIFYFHFFPTFMEDYGSYQLQRMKESGESAAAIAQQAAELRRVNEQYQNPFYNFAITFMEPFPIGLLMTLVSALALKKK